MKRKMIIALLVSLLALSGCGNSAAQSNAVANTSESEKSTATEKTDAVSDDSGQESETEPEKETETTPDETAEPAPDLSGTWKSEDNDGSYQEAVITADTIEINWVSDSGQTKSIYWIGTYTAPTEATDTYEWTSERDKEKTDSALLASTDDSKTFTYSNGKISYSVTALGTTTTLELTPEAEAEEETETTPNESAEPEPVFEELMVIDNEKCTIKITDAEPNGATGYTLKVYMENKTSDETDMFSVSSAAINGVQYDPFFATEIAAGKKANGEIIFTDNNGIGDFTDIEVTFHVYNSDDWLDDTAKETIHIYPLGEDKATKFVRETQETDNTIIDNEYVTVTVIGTEHDALWGYMVNLFLINKSDREIMVSADDVSVNGYMADPFYATMIAPDKCSFSSITWSDSLLEENGISEISEIEFSLRVYDNNDATANDLANETITLNP